MKKMKSFVIVALFLLALSGCDNMYIENNSAKAAEGKQTIKTFDHLNQPIVIALPVYDDSYLLGNSEWGVKKIRRGDIIAVIDTEKDEVFDWIFYPGDHDWSIWRLVEMCSPVKYFMSSKGTGAVACLDPTETALTVTKTDMYTNFSNLSTAGNYGTLGYCRYNRESPEISQDICYVQLYNGDTNTLSDTTLDVLNMEGPNFRNLSSDSDGNFWFVRWLLNNKGYLSKIDCAQERIYGNLAEFDLTLGDDGCPNEDHFSFCEVTCISADYIMLRYVPAARCKHKSLLYVLDRNDLSKHRTIEVIDNPCYLLNVYEVGGKFYAVCPESPITKSTIHIMELDLDSLKATEIKQIHFDMTENVYVRGSRMCFMNSRNPADITYIWYDTSDGSVSEPVRVSADGILSSYSGS